MTTRGTGTFEWILFDDRCRDRSEQYRQIMSGASRPVVIGLPVEMMTELVALLVGPPEGYPSPTKHPCHNCIYFNRLRLTRNDIHCAVHPDLTAENCSDYQEH
jgi:hypothetical protein